MDLVYLQNKSTVQRKKNRFRLKQCTSSAMLSVFARHTEIDQVVLYGSRAKGTYRPGSDIDLALLGLALTYTQLDRTN